MRYLTEDTIAAFDRVVPVGKDPVALAVSGGSDSLALMALGSDWARLRNRLLIVLTVDHGLRPESAQEAVAVADTAAALGLHHRTLRWHSPEPSQVRARRARHCLLATASRQAGAGTLLTGHTLDDQVETFFMRLSRGSGSRGLAAMSSLSVSPVWPEGRGIVIARPLIGLRRADLRANLSCLGLRWVEDPSNENVAFERVRWRRRLALQHDIEGRARSLVRKFSTIRTLENQKLANWFANSVKPQDDSSILVVDTSVDPQVLEPGLSLLVQIAAGSARPPDRARLATLAKVVSNGGPAKGRTIAGAWLVRRRDGLIIARDPGGIDAAASCLDEVWDGRFERCADAAGIASDFAIARRSLPKDDGWASLAASRLNTTVRVLRHI